MMKNIDQKELLENSFVLHTQPYRETSLLVTIFAEKSGRVSLLAKGIKRSAETRFLLQPFTPLVVSWRGKSDLPTLTKVESIGSPLELKAMTLISAMYVNELLTRLLHRHDPHEHIFHLYRQVLTDFSQVDPGREDTIDQQIILRKFEKQFLAHIGYGLPLAYEYNSNRQLLAEAYYQFIPENGFVRVAGIPSCASAFLGQHLLAIAQDCYEDKLVLQASKRLMRLVFQSLLGNRPLKSRELLV